MCAVKALGWLYAVLVAAGRSVGADDYVFAGYTVRDSGALSPSALQLWFKRAVQRHVSEELGAGGKGLTMHSFRRGRLQHERHENGWSLDDLKLLAGIKDVGVLQTYLDRGRHLV